MGCEPRVVHALIELPGVEHAEASHPERRAMVVFDEHQVSEDTICRTLLKAGFVARPQKGGRSQSANISPSAPASIELVPEDLICYCFNYTRNDIEQDFLQNSRSLVIEKIAAEKRRGGCDCAVKNPKGT